MNIKYIGRTTAELEHGKVHKIETSSKTGCGATYSDNPQNWQYTTSLLLAIKMAARTSLRAIEGCRTEGICNPWSRVVRYECIR